WHGLSFFVQLARVQIGDALLDRLPNAVFGLLRLFVEGAALALRELAALVRVALEVAHADQLLPGLVAPLVDAAVLIVQRAEALTRVVEVAVHEVQIR